MVLEEVADAPIPARDTPTAADASIQDIQKALVGIFKHIEEKCAKGATEGLPFTEAGKKLAEAYRSAHKAQATLQPNWWEVTEDHLKALNTGPLQRIKEGCVIRRETFYKKPLGKQWYIAHQLCIDAQEITRLVTARCLEQRQRTFKRWYSLFPKGTEGHVRSPHPYLPRASAEVSTPDIDGGA